MHGSNQGIDEVRSYLLSKIKPTPAPVAQGFMDVAGASASAYEAKILTESFRLFARVAFKTTLYTSGQDRG